MTRGYLQQWGFFHRANRLCKWTAWVEVTPGGWVDRIGDLSRGHRFGTAVTGIRNGDRIQQSMGIGVDGMFVNILHRSNLTQFTKI